MGDGLGILLHDGMLNDHRGHLTYRHAAETSSLPLLGRR
jgi:hypothetical protein